MVLTDFIESLESIPLDGNDLIVMSAKLGNPGCNWMLYNNLAKVKNIEELFPININTMYILLQIQSQNGESIGHWVSLIKYDNVSGFDYGHYDSYGFTIDQEIAITHENPTLLTNLLTGVRIEESRVQHQAFKNKKNDINTCGRHTVTRSIFYYLTNAQYNKMIIQPALNDRNVKNPDVLVSILTGFLPPNDEPVRQFFMNRAQSKGTSF